MFLAYTVSPFLRDSAKMEQVAYKPPHILLLRLVLMQLKRDFGLQGSSIISLLFWSASAAVSALISRVMSLPPFPTPKILSKHLLFPAPHPASSRNYHFLVWGTTLLQSIFKRSTQQQ